MGCVSGFAWGEGPGERGRRGGGWQVVGVEVEVEVDGMAFSASLGMSCITVLIQGPTCGSTTLYVDGISG